MSKEVGALIREARTAAGMSQKDLANAVEGISASVISKAERGEKELTPEQLKAIAGALGVAPESLCEACAAEACPVEAATAQEALTEEEKELLASYRAANADTQKAAVSALKGEKPQAPNLMDMVAGMMGGGGEGGANPLAGGGEGGANPMAGMLGGLAGMMGGGGEGGENPMAGMLGGLMGMMGGANQKKEEGKPSDESKK